MNTVFSLLKTNFERDTLKGKFLIEKFHFWILSDRKKPLLSLR